MVEEELERNGVDRYKFLKNMKGHLVCAFDVNGLHQRMVFSTTTDPRGWLNARGQLRRMIRMAQAGVAA